MAVEAITLSAGATQEIAGDILKRQQEIAKRNLPTFDYEKVFYNSLFGVGIYGLAFLAVKMGGAMITLVNVLNDNGLTGWAVDDTAVANMNKVGKGLGMVDGWMTALGPAMPISIVSLTSGLEYARTRKNMTRQTRVAGDAAVGLAALASVIASFNIIQDLGTGEGAGPDFDPLNPPGAVAPGPNGSPVNLGQTLFVTADQADKDAVAACLQSEPGSPNWDSCKKWDFNKDNIIDIKELVHVNIQMAAKTVKIWRSNNEWIVRLYFCVANQGGFYIGQKRVYHLLDCTGWEWPT